VKQLNARIETEIYEIAENAKASSDPRPMFQDPTFSPSLQKPDWLEDVVRTLETRLDDMSTRVSKITAQTDESAIRFAGLGFRSPKESNAWLVLKMPDHNCGMIVDIHVVMEHVWASIGNKESIVLLEKLLKLKIKHLAEGLAMTSFDNQVPRFFSKATGHKVIRADESYFDAIPSFEEWDHPTTGFRTRLKDELIIFRDGHQTNIDIAFERGSVVYAIATMALVESIAWLEGFSLYSLTNIIETSLRRSLEPRRLGMLPLVWGDG
jgi:hypothetical protein